MPQEPINGILIKGDPLAPHPGALVSDSLLRGPCIGVELHDELWIILSHGCRMLSPLPPGNFLLEFGILSFPQLDLPLLEERPTFNCLKMVLVFLTSEPMSVKLHIHLWGHTGTFSSGIFPCPLSWKLLWSHFLRGHIHKVSCMKYQSSFHLSQTQQKPNKLEWCIFISTKCKCQRVIRKKSYIGACIILLHTFFLKAF